MDDAVRLIPVHLFRIVLRDGAGSQELHLGECGGLRRATIVVGNGEALEIYRVVHGERTGRPMTHQLCLGLVGALCAQLVAVDITSLRDDTYHARLVLRREGHDPVHVDSRASDAIALAMRARVPIRIAEPVLARVSGEGDTLPEDGSAQDVAE